MPSLSPPPFERTAHERVAVRTLVGLLCAGLLLRLALMAAWHPAFMGWPDAKSYLDVAHGELFSSALRPAGYPAFLRVLDGLGAGITTIVLANHVLGLATAAVLFAAVRRAGGPPLLGLVPAAIVALNGDAIFLEHSPLSEPLFIFLTAVGLYAATRTLDRASPGWPALAGVALAGAATVRVVGLALLPLVALWLAFVSHGVFRRRLLSAGAAALAALAVLGTYYGLEQHATGETGLSRRGVWHFYGRVAPFADCSRFLAPPGTAPLCESPAGAPRPTTDAYIFNWWYSPAVRAFGYPFASSPEGAGQVGAFARAVIVHQPLDYLGAVGADMLRYVAPESFRNISGGPSYADLAGKPILRNPQFGQDGLTSIRRYYGYKPRNFQGDRPLMDLLTGYESVTRVQGPLMVLLALLAAAGPLVTRGRARAAALLFSLSGWTLLVAPVASLQFASRTAVPGFGVMGVAAAVGGWGCLEAARRRWPGLLSGRAARLTGS
ncbi:MAG: hypothetical protein ACR2NB_10110 [Solirubrobacteraceae bacterium]